MAADLIVIIAITAFVVWKYRQVLGHKTGHDVESSKDRLHQRRDKAQERVVELKHYQKQHHIVDAQATEITDDALEAVQSSSAKHALESMKQQEQNFSLTEFLQGAKGAFEMVMEAFNEQDRPTLKMLLSEELYGEFDEELKALKESGNKSHTTLVSMMQCEVKEASLKKSTAQITLRFLSEQIHVVVDKDAKVVEGDKSRIEQVEDEWVFERNLKSRNPNWTIVDM